MSRITDPNALFAELRANPTRDWTRFLDIANSLAAPDLAERMFFRGEANARWPRLEASFTRQFPQGPDPEQRLHQALDLEHRAIMQFQEVAHNYLNPAILLPTVTHTRAWQRRGEDLHNWWTTAIQWWALMQHYSAPTRLLDWTRSLFVAAYFAAETAFEEDGKIWCCDKKALDGYMQEGFKRGPHLGHLFPPLETCANPPLDFEKVYKNNDTFFLDMLRQTDRQSVQQGCFMMCKNPLADLKPLLAAAGCLCEIIIPKGEKPVFLERLRSMNITRHSLFPGVDGLGRSIGVWISALSRL